MSGRLSYRSQGEDASIDSRGSPPHRRRVRTQKACDMCHEMKTKCDGAVPCAHCKQSFLDCVYSESRPKRRRNSLPSRKEQRQRPRTMADEETRRHNVAARVLMDNAPEPPRTSHVAVWKPGDSKAPTIDSTPASKVTSVEARFISSSADRAFIERLRRELGEWLGSDIEKRLTILDRPTPRFFSCNRAPRSAAPLPSLQRARQLVNIALDAHILYQVVHIDRFERTFQLLFLLQEGNYSEEETRHLPLVYALLALGVIFEKQSDCPIDTADERLVEALGYFDTCRDLIDVEDPSLLTTLQALFYMTLFLLATSSLNSCYTSLVHVQTLVLRASLHPPNYKNEDIVDTELKARLFWSIRQLLVIVSTSTGLPSPVGAASFHIDLPAGLQETNPSRQSESVAHLLPNRRLLDVPGFLHFINLHNVLDRVIQKLYPPTAVGTARGSFSSHSVRLETVTEFENQLKHWSDNLPESCKHNQAVTRFERANYELLMTYCHVQMYLYRPFLHYLTGPQVNKPSGPSREDFQKYAFTCIEASRNIIYMGEDMNRNGLLYGAEWRIAHMLLTAALSLLYVPLSDRSSTLAAFVMTDLTIAKSLLSALGPYCVRAQRAHLVLTVLSAAFSGPCEESFPTSQNQHGMWDSRQPLPDRPDSAYTAALRRRVIQTPLVLEQDHTSHMATDTSQLLHYSPTQLAQDGLPLCSSSHNELYPLTEMSHFDPREEGAHAPTRVAPEVEIQISSPLQSLAAILDKSDLNPETAFNDPTAYYFDARPSSIFQDIAFDDETFYQLFGDGAEAGIDRTSENFASRFRSFS